MQILHSIHEVAELAQHWHVEEHSISFVALFHGWHAGQKALLQAARAPSGKLLAACLTLPDEFLFCPRLSAVPFALHELEALQVDAVYIPSEFIADIQFHTESSLVAYHQLLKEPLVHELCGVFRPGDLARIAHSVALVAQSIQPDRFFCGTNHWQSCLLIQQQMQRLGISPEFIRIPTVREKDGLVCSDDINHLLPHDRINAAALYHTLEHMAHEILAVPMATSETFPHFLQQLRKIEYQARDKLLLHGFRPDYVSVRRQSDLQLLESPCAELIIVAAAWLDRVRLTDHICIQLNV